MSHILVVEDEAIIRTAVKRLLERHQYQVKEAGSVAETEQYDLTSFDLIISDLRLPGEPGTEMIKRAPDTPVLIMTSYASLRSAVDSMKLGAVDYIAKPFDHDEMVETVQRIIAARSQREQAQASSPPKAAPSKPASSAPKAPATPGEGHDMGIIGSCESMQTLFKRISKVAPTDSTVMIQGESGTGKELVARAMHERSQRAKAPLISVPAPLPVVPVSWKPLTAALCFSMRSANCHWKHRLACCGYCRKARYVASAQCSHIKSTCGW